MNLWQTAVGRRGGRERSQSGLSLAEWAQYFSFNGLSYPILGGSLSQRPEEVMRDFSGYVEGVYRRNGIVFACMEVRRRLFSEARLQFQRVRNGQPGDLYGTQSLAALEVPWPGGSTRDLLSRMIQDVDLGGNFFAVRHPGGLWRLRPDWVTVVSGSPRPDADANAHDTQVIGYVYQPGGPGGGSDPVAFRPETVAHWMPTPDPAHRFLGMSWLTPIIREILADGAATQHKLKFFEQGATPNLVMQMDPEINPESFQRYVELFRENEEGVDNAYRTLFTTAAQVQVVGKDLQQIDFKVTQGAGETRIAAAAGVAPIVAGLSEGLQAATYSNYGQARRHVADGTLRPLWGSACEALNHVVTGAGGDRLWYDDRQISFLQEDQKDAAVIQQTKAITARELITAGYDPDTVAAFIQSDDWSTLAHTGLTSVQLQPPGAQMNGAEQGAGDALIAALNTRVRAAITGPVE